MRKNFSQVPSVNYGRSRFDLSHRKLTSFNEGDLFIADWQEVLPGDSWKIKTNAVIRTSTPFIKPIMDNLFLDLYTFFVPLRLVYDDAEKIFGVARPSMYESDELATMPTIPSGIVSSKSVGDYLELPVGVKLPADFVSIAPFRAFALIYNHWFRNQSVVDEVFVNTGEVDSNEVLNNEPWGPNNYMGKLPKINKHKDYFTSALPSPQKGPSVNIPLSQSVVPVEANTSSQTIDSALRFLRGRSTNNTYVLNAGPGGQGTNIQILGQRGGPTTTANENLIFDPQNLYVDLTSVSMANIQDLYFAFQLEKMLMRDALYGSRYNEVLLASFGVSSPDARLQIPEFISGSRIPITLQQVSQTSVGTDESPLAQVGAYSLSNGQMYSNKGFVEHGILMTVAAVRQVHTYQQGIPKKFTKLRRTDIYEPLFAGIGEQPIKSVELFVDNNSNTEDIFGYNEAWADYKSLQNRITGQMRSNVENSLDRWHLGDYFANKPSLVPSFVQENAVNLDRSLSVESSEQDNFIADFYFDTKTIRVMPTYAHFGKEFGR